MDIPVSEFRRAAERLTEWIAAYLENPERYPVLADVRPGEIAARLPVTAPESPQSLGVILDDFEKILLPGVTHWNHPGFFAYFSISASAPGILAEYLTAALDINAMLWKGAPAATELEQRSLDWLRQMLGMGDGWFGVINDTASIGTLLALAAAREAKPELKIRERGMAGRSDLPILRIYASEHAHSSVDKAVMALGYGHENLVKIPGNERFEMAPQALARAIEHDRAHRMLPLAVVATVGTTASASVDPLPAIAGICSRESLWLHVDASYAGPAAIVPERRDVLAGVEQADSLVVNPHKWLFTPTDISALFSRRPDVLKRAFALVPEYLSTAESGVVNLMDYGVQLGRRFRALKLWMVIRAFGVEGIVQRLRYHMELAREFAGWVDADPSWEVLAPVNFSLVCFRYAPAEASEALRQQLNRAILERVNASGRVFLSHAKLNGRFTLRLAIGNLRTERRHVADAWYLLQDAAAAVLPSELGIVAADEVHE